MLYFSELGNKQVRSSSGEIIGRLDDLIFSFQKTPSIKKLYIVKGRKRFFDRKRILDKEQKVIIPLEYVDRFDNEQFILKKNFQESTVAENELFLKKNLLDTQVIDIEENNIVRVNDVLIQKVGRDYIIFGVDIGLAGLLRWIGLEDAAERFFRTFRITFYNQVLSWSDIQPLELTRGRVVVKSKFNSLQSVHPADLADYLETQNLKNSMKLIEGIDKHYVADVLSELSPAYQVSILRRISVDKLVPIVAAMHLDDAIDIIAVLAKKKQEALLEKLPHDISQQITNLIHISDTALGKFISPDYLAVRSTETTASVLKKIKNSTKNYSNLDYIYVVNKQNQLVGVFSLHDLLLQKNETPVYKFMTTRIVTATLSTPLEIAYRRIVKYKITAIPVIVDERQMLGVVTIDDISEAVMNRIYAT